MYSGSTSRWSQQPARAGFCMRGVSSGAGEMSHFVASWSELLQYQNALAVDAKDGPCPIMKARGCVSPPELRRSVKVDMLQASKRHSPPLRSASNLLLRNERKLYQLVWFLQTMQKHGLSTLRGAQRLSGVRFTDWLVTRSFPVSDSGTPVW